MDIKQSFLISIAKVRLSLYEQRILLKVMEYGQVRLQGVFLSEHKEKMPHDMDNVQIIVPTSSILSEGSQHYEYVYDAARALCKRTFELYDSEKKKWFCTPLIYNVVSDEGRGQFSFYVSKTLFDVMYDFSRGFCMYDLATALALPTPYAVRLYVLLNGQHHPIEYRIDYLKEMFGVQEQYAQTADFIKRVIEPSKTALDKANVNSFTYERITKGKKVTALRFFPVYRTSEKSEVMRSSTISDAVKRKAIQMILLYDLKMSYKEIGAHSGLLDAMSEHPYGIEVTRDIVHRALKQGKRPGWVINALKAEIQNPTMLKK